MAAIYIKYISNVAIIMWFYHVYENILNNYWRNFRFYTLFTWPNEAILFKWEARYWKVSKLCSGNSWSNFLMRNILFSGLSCRLALMIESYKSEITNKNNVNLSKPWSYVYLLSGMTPKQLTKSANPERAEVYTLNEVYYPSGTLRVQGVHYGVPPRCNLSMCVRGVVLFIYT